MNMILIEKLKNGGVIHDNELEKVQKMLMSIQKQQVSRHKYYEKVKEEHNQYMKEYYKKRLQTNPEFKQYKSDYDKKRRQMIKAKKEEEKKKLEEQPKE